LPAARVLDEEQTLRKISVTLLVLPLFVLSVLSGCYSGYQVKVEDLARIGSETQERGVKLTSTSGEELVVEEATGVEVHDHDGLTYRLQPYTFKLTSTQLVAPEQDLVLPIGTIDRVEIRKLNALGTIGLVGLGGAAATGIVIGIAATAGEDTGFE